MQRHRVLLAFGIAWFAALLLSWWVYRQATAPQTRNTVQVVAAAHDLPVGKKLAAGDVRLVAIDRKDLPQGAAFKTADLTDRAAAVAIGANELVLERKLAPKGGGESLTALIEPGMRAMSVAVNEMSSVAGFAQPGTRVDVLFTRMLPNGDATTTTILQNVKVLAFGRQLEPGGKTDLRATAGQTAATLLVTQEQAEKLALAVQRGRIQLALRNPLDTATEPESRLVRSADLMTDAPVATVPRPAAARPGEVPGSRGARPSVTPAPGTDAAGDPQAPVPGAPVGITKSQTNGRIVVKVFRGSKMTEEVFQ